MLLHFQHDRYNTSYERFPRILEKFPKVNFIGHAQTFWANIDAKHPDQKMLYPKGPVTAGGLTDKYLSDYPNLFGDLSAGSGHNALNRDLEFTRSFIARRQDRLMFGTDYLSPGQKVPQFELFDKLALAPDVQARIFSDNARRVIGIRCAIVSLPRSAWSP